jgi:hypothetical protein
MNVTLVIVSLLLFLYLHYQTGIRETRIQNIQSATAPSVGSRNFISKSLTNRKKQARKWGQETPSDPTVPINPLGALSIPNIYPYGRLQIMPVNNAGFVMFAAIRTKDGTTYTQNILNPNSATVNIPKCIRGSNNPDIQVIIYQVIPLFRDQPVCIVNISCGTTADAIIIKEYGAIGTESCTVDRVENAVETFVGRTTRRDFVPITVN